MKKKALGKGLEAFLSEEYGILKEDRYMEMETEKLRPNPFQPRTKFDPASIAELAQSIKETGILQPIVVVPDNPHYRGTRACRRDSHRHARNSRKCHHPAK